MEARLEAVTKSSPVVDQISCCYLVVLSIISESLPLLRSMSSTVVNSSKANLTMPGQSLSRSLNSTDFHSHNQ